MYVHIMITTATVKRSANSNHQPTTLGASSREKILANTMSVDEYFDELIDQVKSDYANL